MVNAWAEWKVKSDENDKDETNRSCKERSSVVKQDSVKCLFLLLTVFFESIDIIATYNGS